MSEGSQDDSSTLSERLCPVSFLHRPFRICARLRPPVLSGSTCVLTACSPLRASVTVAPNSPQDCKHTCLLAAHVLLNTPFLPLRKTCSPLLHLTETRLPSSSAQASFLQEAISGPHFKVPLSYPPPQHPAHPPTSWCTWFGDCLMPLCLTLDCVSSENQDYGFRVLIFQLPSLGPSAVLHT